ncbi:hypothetical protein HELRODRAFT_191309 [Helobdella robusta]|uniref:RNA helicase n=1 Tax=Helobdella robusta TaxID=6412 RepID=T1FSV4_HELRO|nr:hypothetical protein HELRODRAFT_191309 [Helobdella robusta]ESO05489.1 hypothetical protein HELRODRAFT_191309 [Helobdella robusta]
MEMKRRHKGFLKPADDDDYLTSAEAQPIDRKIGEERAGFGEERIITYNFNHSSTIEQQRQRLPIFKYRTHILYLLEKYSVLIIIGETGSGKSTQIPQFLLESGWAGDNKCICVTQPRKMAAVSLAMRVADEKGVTLGEEVGYSVRFEECCSEKLTKIKFVTDGLIIREMMSDPLLKQYSIIMIDEAHERSLNTDIVIGLLKKIQRKRPELKLIVSSATIDAELMMNFFNTNETDDPTKNTVAALTVEGRMYPVDIFYQLDPVPNYLDAMVETVIKIHTHEKPGDVLAFVTGQEEVEKVVKELKSRSSTMTDDDKPFLKIIPLYAGLPFKDQMKAFERPTTVPEMQRSNMAGVILQLKALGIDNVLKFNFLSSPSVDAMLCGLELLYALEALDDNCHLTDPIGQQMAEFPLNPCFSKMLIMSGRFGCSKEAVAICSMTQIQNVFIMPHNKKMKMEKMKRKFSVAQGDHLTLLNVFRAFINSNKNPRWCKENYLNYKGLMRAVELEQRLINYLRRFKIPLESCEDDPERIIRCLAAGLFCNTAKYHPSGVYRTIRDDHCLSIHPTSVLYTELPADYVVFNEVVHSGGDKEFMRDVTVVKLEFLTDVAKHYFDYGSDGPAAKRSKYDF